MQAGDGVFYSATNIYLQPTTLSAITFNFIMALCGGLMAGYIVSKGDPFWTFSGGLAGVIGTSAGNDLYHPIQAFIIAAIIVVIIYKLHYWVERRFKIDDAVGAVAVHGYTGFLGVVAAGFVLWGYPSSPDALLGARSGAVGQRHAVGPVRRRGHHVLRARLHPRLRPVVDPEAGRACCASRARWRSPASTTSTSRRPGRRTTRCAQVLAQEVAATRAGRGGPRLSAAGRIIEIGGCIMTTGNFANWDGTITDTRPALSLRRMGRADGHHPPRGLGRLAHRQIRMENQTHDEAARMLRQGDNLHKATLEEHTIERM